MIKGIKKMMKKKVPSKILYKSKSKRSQGDHHITKSWLAVEIL